MAKNINTVATKASATEAAQAKVQAWADKKIADIGKKSAIVVAQAPRRIRKSAASAQALVMTATKKVAAQPEIAVKPAKVVTRAQILDWWPETRAIRILQIMKEDGISYERAVKRSRRRMIAEMIG